MTRQHANGLIAVLALCTAGCGVQGKSAVPPTAPQACAPEAERLVSSAVVSLPDGTRVVLDPGRWIYRCAESGDWLGVMFPQADAPVDCSQRQADRACARGWIEAEPETESFG